MSVKKTTEQDSNYNHLEKMSLSELLININTEDKTVAFAVEKAIPQIELLSKIIVKKLTNGGRLFYIGASNYALKLFLLQLNALIYAYS